MTKSGIMSCFSRLAMLAVLIAFPINSSIAQNSFSNYVDSEGNISFPAGFRDSMVHLGSWFVPEGGASGFHDVYTERASAEAYRETGEFPDGAAIIKELRASEPGNYTTGNGVHHATENLKQWFVMIKDKNARFPGNSLWGDGWGWALFKPGDKETNAATDYKTDCLACHVPAQSNDWIYVEAYPMLNAKY